MNLAIPFQFFSNGDQRFAGGSVDTFIEWGYMFEKIAQCDQGLPGLAGENVAGSRFC